jgi:hypothetical protein
LYFLIFSGYFIRRTRSSALVRLRWAHEEDNAAGFRRPLYYAAVLRVTRILAFTQHMNTDLSRAGAYSLQSFPITWFKSLLDYSKLEAGGTASLLREIPKIVQTRLQISGGSWPQTESYKFLYIWQVISEPFFFQFTGFTDSCEPCRR